MAALGLKLRLLCFGQEALDQLSHLSAHLQIFISEGAQGILVGIKDLTQPSQWWWLCYLSLRPSLGKPQVLLAFLEDLPGLQFCPSPKAAELCTLFPHPGTIREPHL